MGEDGHTASLYPGDASLKETASVLPGLSLVDGLLLSMRLSIFKHAISCGFASVNI